MAQHQPVTTDPTRLVMGLGGVEGPPKKKLKQAQLNFCVSTEKTSNKRKLSDASDGLAPKLFRKDPEAAKTPIFNKENVVTKNVAKPSDGQKKAEPINDVVVIDDDSKDNDKPLCEPTESSAASHKAVEADAIEIDDVRQESKIDVADPKSKLDATTLPAANVNYTQSATEDTAKPVQVDEISDSRAKTSKCNDPKDEPDHLAKDESVSNVPEELSDTKAGKDHTEEKDGDESKHDKSADSDQADMNTSVTSEDDPAASPPNQKNTPSRRSLATPKSSSKKAERERQREEKLRLKKEKEEQKRKEKEDKEKKKQEELRLKEEEKKLKEEAKKRKEEERKRKEEAKEEEKRKKEEEKKKKEMKEEAQRRKKEERLAEERKEKEKEERAKAAFTKFFIFEKTPKPSLPKEEETEAHTEKSERPKFMPFPVKSDMRLAVQVRHTLTEDEKNILSKALGSNQSVEKTYLKELKSRKPMSSSATWPLSDEEHDVIIVEFVEEDKTAVKPKTKSVAKAKDQKAKLLQFHENRRPPYWGTWRKSSSTVGPRRPFGQDKILDYEVDSDSEWEDEEEGEDIDKEDGDSDKEEADDENVGENGYVLDNTFVPHGYLSDEEAAEAEDDDSVEDQKLKLTVLKQEFDQELKSKTQRLQPRLLGCVYISNKTLEVSKSLYEPLMKLRCKWDPNEDPIDVLSPAVVECGPSPSVSNVKFPSSMVEQLAKLIHGNKSSLKALISAFLDNCEKDTQLSAVSKRAVFLKVKEIAAKTYSSGSGRLVWAVHPDLCADFGLEPIIDQPKAVPVSPVVELTKPKDSPLASFLKKTPTPQGPIKRVSTTLVPRSGPSEKPFQGSAVHVDTPRPKVTTQGTLLASHADKPIRRVATTLLSPVARPVKNNTFNVGEIDKPGQPVSANVPKISVNEMVDLTDSIDGITPLPNEVNESVPPVLAASNLGNSPVRVSGGLAKQDTSATIKLANPAVTVTSDTADQRAPVVIDQANQSFHAASDTSKAPIQDATVSAATDSSKAPGKDATIPADSSAQAIVTPATKEFKPVSMETDESTVPTGDPKEPGDASKAAEVTTHSIISSSAPIVDSANQPASANKDSAYQSVPAALVKDSPDVSTESKPDPVETDGSSVRTNATVKPDDDAKAVKVAPDSNVSSSAPSDAQPSPMETDSPPKLTTTDTEPLVSSDASLPIGSTSDKPTTANDAKTIPATPTPIRKRVPLITLSKTVSKTINTISPGQKVSIADMFYRQANNINVTPSETSSLKPPAIVDRSSD